MPYRQLKRHVSKAVETHQARPSFFAHFFPRVDVHDSDIVEFDKKDIENGIAPFVKPEIFGKAVEIKGYDNHILKLPTMKPTWIVTSKDLSKKPFGKTVYDDVAKNATARKIANDAVDDNERRIDVRLESMRAEALFSGEITIEGEGYDHVLTFPRNANNTVDVGAGGLAYWDQAGATIDEDISEMMNILAAAGKTGTHIVGRPASIKPLVDFAATQTDFRRVENGHLRFKNLLNVNGAIYEGTYKGLEIWSYMGTYKDADGNTDYMVPEKQVVMLSADNDNEMSYGYSADVLLELGVSKDYTVSNRNVITKLLTRDQVNVEIQSTLTAAPILKDCDSTLVATVLA